MQNVIVTLFNVESEGYQAITELKNNPGSDASFVSEAALIRKTGTSYNVLDGFDTGAHSTNDTVKGTLIGMCVGILGGPIGMLLGAGIGSLAGMSMDADDVSLGTSMLEQIISKIQDGDLALIALADEEDESILDAKLTRYDATMIRCDAAVVAQEVVKAQEMEKEMERQTKQELRKQKKEENKEKVETQRNKIKASFAARKEKKKKEKEEKKENKENE